LEDVILADQIAEARPLRRKKISHETTVRLLLRQAGNRIRSDRSSVPFSRELDANKEFADHRTSMFGIFIVALSFFAGVVFLWLKIVGPTGV